MSKADKYPIDVELWKNERNAPSSEKWKWGWSIWDPIIDKVYNGVPNISDLECPVCGHKDLYFYFLVFHISIEGSLREGRTVYLADRFYGCHHCQTQVRDYGLVPGWVAERDISWVSPKAKEEEEARLTRRKASMSHDSAPGT